MGREPSIHISRTRLIQILQECQIGGAKEAELIMKKAVKHSLSNRGLIISNDKIKREATKIVKASQSDSQLLSKLIHDIRVQHLKHRGVTRITPGNITWEQLKNLAVKCVDFCNEFGLDKKKGFIEYLKIGLPKISSTRNYLQKLTAMYESICQIYDAKSIIETDNDSELTKEVHDHYVQRISKHTGIYQSYVDDPITYKYFLGVKEIVKKYDVPPEIYIKAQFIGLSFTESIPTPNQLVTEKAIQRLNNYLYKNKLKVETKKDIKLSRVEMLKRIKANDKDRAE